MKALLELVARPPFLALPVALVVLGAAAGAYDGPLSVPRTLLGLVAVLAMYAAVNAFHVRFSLRHGHDHPGAHAPHVWETGAPPPGEITAAGALRTGLIAAGVAAAVAVYFLLDPVERGGGAPILPVTLAGAIVVLFHADVFDRIGLGEVTLAVGLGGLPVLGTGMIQDGFAGPAAVAAALVAFFMVFALSVLDGITDEAADRAAGRRTLAVLLGRKTAARLFGMAVMTVPLFLVAVTVVAMLPSISLLGLLPFLLVMGALGWAILRPGEPVPSGLLAQTVAWSITTALLLSVALFVSIYFQF